MKTVNHDGTFGSWLNFAEARELSEFLDPSTRYKYREDRKGTYGIGNYIKISRDGVTDRYGKPISKYKDNKIEGLENLADGFSRISDMFKYSEINGAPVSIDFILVKTASNGCGVHKIFDESTRKWPIEKYNTSFIVDRVVWYSILGHVGDKSARTGWEAYCGYSYAAEAASRAADRIISTISIPNDFTKNVLYDFTVDLAKAETAAKMLDQHKQRLAEIKAAKQSQEIQ
jgi:hypothetical protein